MENSIQFNKKPFHGIFSEAAKELGVTGKNARIITRTAYFDGSRKAVEVVTKLINRRLKEVEAHKATLQRAASIQNQSAGV